MTETTVSYWVHGLAVLPGSVAWRRCAVSLKWAKQQIPLSAEAECWILLYPRVAALSRKVQRRASRSMTEIAVLLALYATGTAEAQALRQNVLADAGHLSRILAALETKGLVTRATSSIDGRQQRVTLTTAGA